MNGKLPDGWEEKKLGEVFEVFADGDWIESKDQPAERKRSGGVCKIAEDQG